MADKNDLMAALNSASAEDLGKIDARIAECERELDSLRAVRRVIDIRVNGDGRRKPRKPREPEAAKADEPDEAEYRQRMAKYVAKHGRTLVVPLSEVCGIPHGLINRLALHEWFERTSAGISLSPKGRQLFG